MYFNCKETLSIFYSYKPGISKTKRFIERLPRLPENVYSTDLFSGLIIVVRKSSFLDKGHAYKLNSTYFPIRD